MKQVTCVDVHGRKYKVSVGQLEWRPSVYGVIIKDGRILLSKQFGDRYDLPGGGVDLGEKFERAVLREIHEETGIQVKNPALLGAEENFFMDSHALGKAYHSILFYYHCEFVSGKISTEGFDQWEKKYAGPAEWIALSKLDQIKPASTVDFRPYVKRALAK